MSQTGTNQLNELSKGATTRILPQNETNDVKNQPKLKSLLPKNLLNASSNSKNHVCVEIIQAACESDSEMKSVYEENSDRTIEGGEVILSQPNEEVRMLSETTISSSPEISLDNLLKQLGNAASTHQVVALTEDQIQRLLSITGHTDTIRSEEKPHMLTMVSVDGDSQQLSLVLDNDHTDHTFSIAADQAQNPLEPDTEGFTVMQMHESGSQAMETAHTSTGVQPASVNVIEALSYSNAIPTVSMIKTETLPNHHQITTAAAHAGSPEDSYLGYSQPQDQQTTNTSSMSQYPLAKDSEHELVIENLTHATEVKVSEPPAKEEVVRKTMVETFVKMIVCKKVTVQTINQQTGQVLDTKVKLEEEEPVILGVDCVETTEDFNTSSQSTSGGDNLLPNPHADGGLQFLSAISESRKKIGKNILAETFLKSALGKKSSQLSERVDVWDSAQSCMNSFGTESVGGSLVKVEPRGESDSEWAEDGHDDDPSKNYTPGKDKLGKSITGASSVRGGQKCYNAGISKGSIKTKRGEHALPIPRFTLRKRGRKRLWENTLGISTNLKTCPFCSKRYNSVEACAQHMKKGGCVDSLSCLICSKKFQDEHQLELHLLTHDEQARTSQFECADCNRTYRTRVGYIKHFRMGTCKKRDEFEDGEEGEFSCDLCSLRFSTESYLRLHCYKVHENPADKHVCNKCGKKFYSLQGFNKHRSGRPCTDPLTCKICGKTYSSKARESYKIHMRQHKSEATGLMFECDECDRTYLTQMALNKHKLSHTGAKPYKCEVCGKAFAMRYMVKDHARTHTGERPYPCELCGSAFSNRGHLARHMRSHENGTLLKRGRPKKIRDTEESNQVGLTIHQPGESHHARPVQGVKVLDLGQALQQAMGSQGVTVVDGGTIIITDGWTHSVTGSLDDQTVIATSAAAPVVRSNLVAPTVRAMTPNVVASTPQSLSTPVGHSSVAQTSIISSLRTNLAPPIARAIAPATRAIAPATASNNV